MRIDLNMLILYDGNCKLCRRTMSLFRSLNWTGGLTFVNALDPKEVSAHGVDWLDAKETLKNMHVVEGDRVWIGFYGYRALSRHLPLFWPILPFLYVWPVPRFGKKVYRTVADMRACQIPNK